MSNCKVQSRRGDALDSSVQFISVDGAVTFAFRSELALQCDVVMDNTSYACNKPAASKSTWQAQLGKLDPARRQELVLHLRPEGGEASQRTYTWRGVRRGEHDFRLKLNVPLMTAEVVQVEGMPMPEHAATVSGCRATSGGDEVFKHAAVPFGITELATVGFGEASARYHAHDANYVRLNYEDFADEQEWDFRYVLAEIETLFTLKPPARLRAVSIDGGHGDFALVGTLMTQRRLGKVNAPVEVRWKIANPTPKMRLSISFTGDDKGAQGECFADPKDGRMELDGEFLQQLPAGDYTMLVQLHSTQRVDIFGTVSASWLVDAHDWRQGTIAKR